MRCRSEARIAEGQLGGRCNNPEGRLKCEQGAGEEGSDSMDAVEGKTTRQRQVVDGFRKAMNHTGLFPFARIRYHK